KHKELFFGRGAASDQLAARVTNERFVVVTGPSGLGKSSLVRAGVIPRISDRLMPVIMRPSVPGPTPFASLAAALKDASAAATSPDEESLRASAQTLIDWVKAQAGDREVLLVIDQAEELITMSSKEDIAAGFLKLLAGALDGSERLRVVLTVRSEFEPQFAAQSPLKDRWQAARFLVPQMTQDELRRVIEGPAAVKAMRFESPE